MWQKGVAKGQNDAEDITELNKMIESLENPEEDEMLMHFVCPLTLEILREPVNTIYGHKFERKAICLLYTSPSPRDRG